MRRDRDAARARRARGVRTTAHRHAGTIAHPPRATPPANPRACGARAATASPRAIAATYDASARVAGASALPDGDILDGAMATAHYRPASTARNRKDVR